MPAAVIPELIRDIPQLGAALGQGKGGRSGFGQGACFPSIADPIARQTDFVAFMLW